MDHDDDMGSNMQQLIAAKAEELFNLCDTEQKGFIIKKDMQRLREELGVEPEQLEDVFDSLDNDHNGYLTLEEFTSGFGMFLGEQMGGGHPNDQEMIEHDPNEKEEQQLFHDTLESLGAKDLYDDEETIMGLWMKLRENDPTLLRQFEQFIGKVTEEIRRSKLDHRSIEAALQSKSSVHESEIKKLYDEMEQQIKAEKAKVLAQEKLKERELREQMERELRGKEQQLAEITKKQSELELKLLRVNMNETETKSENDRLQKQKSQLEEQLQEITKSLEESKNYISQLQIQTKKEKRDRAKQALSLTESIALERENLVKQLDSLKTINKRLVDERDLHHGARQQDQPSSPTHSSRKPMRKQGSILSDYFTPSHREPEEDDDGTSPSQDNRRRRSRYSKDTDSESEQDQQSKRSHRPRRYSRRHQPRPSASSDSEDMNDNLDRFLVSNFQKHQFTINYMSKRALLQPGHELGAREQPVGANTVFQHSELMNVSPNAVPERMFKVAFIGDSGVGKTSFIQRFCTDSFKDSFSATIGVDLQVKMMNIENRIIALQLWDTAGQERFRSITKQYFRKSDGVILVYDVTSEITFRNVRQWMTSVRESAEDDCVVALVGNKTDLCDDDGKRPVKYKDGAKLADEYGCLFFESSAKLGTSIVEIMEAIARIMQDKDDKQRKGENIVDISSKKKKRGCC
ncbi:unnamed protein product [Adineta ricciae]|uniref:EF-hand domain-containing protein n=1 Tax=Adineta ricciae TaxID=249248 RepID=A0A814WR36_ADIRI|nr:unnamed protein product [Adineta ricciae]CAF1205643.1 unnamed protein product [Adineta ricciae]